MDNDLKKLINETINETYAAAPEKLVERGIREIQYDICPHCKKQINEYEEYTEDGGTSWRHRHCKGLITRPETPLEQINRSFQPYVVESRRERHAARKALGMENVIQGACPEDATEPTSLPVGGHKKYDKQQPEDREGRTTAYCRTRLCQIYGWVGSGGKHYPHSDYSCHQ